MTESEWLNCTDPQRMLTFLWGKGKLSKRKALLFACAAVRGVWHLLSDRYSRDAVTVAERYAGGEVAGDELDSACGDARRAAQVACRQEQGTAEGRAMWAVSLLCEADMMKVVHGTVELV